MYNCVGGSNNFLLKFFAIHFSSIKAIAFTWVMAFSLALAPLLGWSYYEPESNGIRYIVYDLLMYHNIDFYNKIDESYNQILNSKYDSFYKLCPGVA